MNKEQNTIQDDNSLEVMRKRLLEEIDDNAEPDVLALAGDQEEEAGTLTPAEVITNVDLAPEDKKRELLRTWGRKGGIKTAKLTTKFKPQFVNIARKLAMIGVNEGDIAALFQVNSKTFRGWKRRHPPLTRALKEGEALKKANLIQQMQASAYGGIFQMQIFLAKNWLGMTDRHDVKTSGEQTIVYKSNIPREAGNPGVDPGSKKRTTKKIQDREEV